MTTTKKPTKPTKPTKPIKPAKPAKPAKPTKPAGSGFADLHFKLSVVSALMEEGHYVDEIDAAAEGAEDPEAYRPIAEVMAYVERLAIPKELLATVTSLQPDGGDLIYQAATTEWDGEDEIFDITSIEGIDALANLESFAPIAMITQKGIDYTPLLGCKKLKRVDFAFAAKGAANKAVRKELLARGVDVGEA